MLRRVLSSSRYIVVIPVVGAFIASLALMFYEVAVVITSVVETAWLRSATPKDAKALAVGLIEAVDVFLIAIALYIISLGLYTLFVDDTLDLPKWLEIRDLDDLKDSLVSVVVVVLAVLFLREAITRESGVDLLAFGAGLALMIGSLTFFLTKKGMRRE